MTSFVASIKRVAKIILGIFGILVAIGLAEVVFNHVRGYQIVTLKTLMYWDNGKAVRGSKIKTWQIAVPVDIQLHGTISSVTALGRWFSLEPAWDPLALNLRRKDTFRFIDLSTSVAKDDNLVPSGKGVARFEINLSNKIPNTTLGPRGGVVYFRQPGTRECVTQGDFTDYHGWVIDVSSDIEPARRCAIVTKNFDKWTLHIDDLTSKDSGE